MKSKGDRWILFALAGAVLAMLAIGLALYLPGSRVTWVLGAGVLVFALIVYVNPRRWYRRMSATALSMAALCATLPSILVETQILEIGRLSIVQESSIAIGIGFLVVSIVLAWLDLKKAQGPVATAPGTRAPSSRPTTDVVLDLAPVFLIVTIPVVVVAVVFRAALLSHPIVSALVGLVWYISTVPTLAILLRVFRRLSDAWVEPLASWANTELGLRSGGHLRRYSDFVRTRYRAVQLRGLRTQGAFAVEVERIFVELRLSAESPQKLTPDMLRRGDRERTMSPWRILSSGDPAYRSVAVVGPPGSGKSTLLRHLALTLLANRQRRYERACPSMLPLLLQLREHRDAITGPNPPSLASLLTGFAASKGLRLPESWFERHLTTPGRCVVLLDGLDEIGDLADRRRARDWIDAQVGRYGHQRFVVTSRPRGYQSAPMDVVSVFEVCSFGLGTQVPEFVRGWYRANEILRHGGRIDVGIEREAGERAADLLGRIASSPTLSELAVNPLLLTMIAIVHYHRGALPDHRVELYREIVDVFLGHWQEAKGLTHRIASDQKRVVLQNLAYAMMERRTHRIGLGDAGTLLVPALRGLSESEIEPGEFLGMIEQSSSILLEREHEQWEFAHPTIQEYLAARHAVDTTLQQEMLGRVGDPW